MALDFTPLQLHHLLLFGGCFLGVYGLFALLLRYSPWSLRKHGSNPSIYFGGVVLIGVISLTSYFLLDDARLRIGLLAAAFLTLGVGIIDEQLQLPPGKQFVWQMVIAALASSWGWTITTISNPWQGGVIDLQWYTVGALILPGFFLSIIWLVFLMNAMNWLDGVDGLASGVGMVAMLTLAAVSLLPSVQDSQTLTLAMIGAGSITGFLLWNFSPARIYLGTSGSWFLGLFIGMVAIVGGGKIITTLLVLAIPVIDVLTVTVSRLLKGQRPWQRDTVHHLHYRLRRANVHPRIIATLGIAGSAVLGYAAITLQTEQKMVAFVGAAAMLVVVLITLMYRQSRTSVNL